MLGDWVVVRSFDAVLKELEVVVVAPCIDVIIDLDSIEETLIDDGPLGDENVLDSDEIVGDNMVSDAALIILVVTSPVEVRVAPDS